MKLIRECAECESLREKAEQAVRRREDEIAALKAQAGEPVCWIYELSGYRSIAWGSSKPDFPAAKNPVPLFTHPTTERSVVPEDVRKVMADGNVTLGGAAPSQEPVAWMKDTSYITTHFAKVEFNGATPLYTSPPDATAQIVKLEEALKVADEGREYANELLQIAAVDITKLKKSINKVSKRSRERAEELDLLRTQVRELRHNAQCTPNDPST